MLRAKRKRLFIIFIIIHVLFSHQLAEVNCDTISEIYGNELLEHYIYFESGPYGSFRGGEFFTDFYQSLDGTDIRPTHWPDKINIRSGERIDSIQMFYGPYIGGFHGGEGGILHKIRLYGTDRITRITGNSGLGPGAGVDQLTFYTKSGERYGPFGGDGGRSFDAKPPYKNCYLAFISGRAFLRLDSILFHWRCPFTKEMIQQSGNNKNEPEQPIDPVKFYDVSQSSRTAQPKKLSLYLSLLFVLFIYNVINYLPVLTE